MVKGARHALPCISAEILFHTIFIASGFLRCVFVDFGEGG